MGEKQNTNIEKNEKVQENITNVSTNEVKIEDYSNNQKDHFEPQSEENNRRNNNNLLVIILAILVLILAGVVTYLILASKKEQQPVSKVAPTLVLIGENSITLTEGEAYVDPGYQANDDKDGDITGKVVIEGTVNSEKAGFYTILYSVTDSDSLTSSLTRKVTVVSKETTLTLELKGEEIAVINKDETYVEPGYIAKDTKEGDLSSNVVITGKVNSNVAGKYTLTYSVTNSATEVATATRTIIVVAPIKELSLTNATVKKLMTYISSTYYNLPFTTYQSKKVTYKDLSYENLLLISYYSTILNNSKYVCEDKPSITLEELKKTLVKIYNTSSIKMPKELTVITGYFNYGSGFSGLGLYDGVVGGVQEKTEICEYTSPTITSAIEEGNYIYLYSEDSIGYVKIHDNYQPKLTTLIDEDYEYDYCQKDSIIGTIYAYSDSVEKIGDIKCIDKGLVTDKTTGNVVKVNEDEIKEVYSVKNYAKKYKHTFAKNTTGEYYWVSTEPIN